MDEQKILDTLRFTWRNLNSAEVELKREGIAKLDLKRMALRLSATKSKVEDALKEFEVKQDEVKEINY